MRYAVSFIYFGDNDLRTKIVTGGNWKEALNEVVPDFVEYLSDDIEDAKEQAFNGDCMFDVIEIG